MNMERLDEVKAVFGNLGSSNDARLAKLERRFMVPPSPAGSGEVVNQGPAPMMANTNSLQSFGSGVQQHSSSLIQTPQGSHMEEDVSQSQDGQGEGQTNKKRRIQATMNIAGMSRRERSTTPSAYNRGMVSPNLNTAEGPNKAPGSTPGSKGKQKNTISRYFPTIPGSETLGEEGEEKQERGGPLPVDPLPAAVQRALEKESAALREENRQLAVELQKSQEERSHLDAAMQRLERDTAEMKEEATARDGTVREVLMRLATSNARHERELTTQRLQAAAPRLGSLSVRRKGIDVQEVWEDGSAFKDMQQRLTAISSQRESIEAARKAAKRRLPLPGQALPTERHGASENTNPANPGQPAALHPDDWVVQEEVYKVRLAALKREEDSLRADAARLDGEKTIHVRELKRVRDEEGSRFGNFPVLNNRYLLLNMLGRGGFSEVFRAFDLSSLRSVAVKIHQLSSQWSEAKKASYVKHSVREYHIHRGLHHPRIVSLLDIFEIDNNTFATVLELCTGGDLEAYVKTHDALPEREARAIVAQVLSALAYLNTKPRSVIHYDLKPANILFDLNGECKVTDFGLSKVVEDGHTQGMELTSQGAGTYWYLPPECFDVKSTPRISNKVDVWSVGVILYQMLYARRPFGHDQSQEQILRNEVMLNARELQFPTKPSVSAECKDFLKQCLAYRQEDRMDVHAAVAHPFFNMKKEKRGSGVGSGARDVAGVGASAAGHT